MTNAILITVITIIAAMQLKINIKKLITLALLPVTFFTLFYAVSNIAIYSRMMESILNTIFFASLYILATSAPFAFIMLFLETKYSLSTFKMLLIAMPLIVILTTIYANFWVVLYAVPIGLFSIMVVNYKQMGE